MIDRLRSLGDDSPKSRSTVSLAVVIPAFKARYFQSALLSLAQQTDSDFTVYVGDDQSPDDLRTICEAFRGRLRIDYERFSRRLGSTSLAGHWNRCVARSTEAWVWLFSDDDIADPFCVEALKAEIASDADAHDVYRFPVAMIDAGDRLRLGPARYGDVQSPLDFAAARLRYAQMSFAVDSVFSRSAFRREGGFVDFPFGWCSDTASWIAFARLTGIRQLQGGCVYWRRSDVNLSRHDAPIQREKIAAAIAFLEWLNVELDTLRASDDERRRLRGLYEGWFYPQLYALSPRLRAGEIVRYGARLARAFGTPRRRALYRLVRSALRVRLGGRSPPSPW